MSERPADVTALESAVIWHTLASAMVEAPGVLSASEAAYVLARVVESLGEVLPLAIAATDSSQSVRLPSWRDTASDLNAALRGMRT
ncbi:hypothetical protein [Streptomyces sp. NPDC093269]|uniref:hypothetical protein n=1 Tax=Streptomyces sp. NPDC093269 TaxID=3366038 RepID=UPI00383067EF